MKIIRLGIISKIKGGKGTAEKYLRTRYGAESVRYSTPLREMLNCLGVAQTRENLQDISTYMRGRHGEEVIGDEIVRRLNRLTSSYQVIEGIRRPMDIVSLRKDPVFRCVYVTSSPVTRYDRQVKFPENPGDETMTFERFLERDLAEAEKDIEVIGEQADFRIVNDGNTLAEYHACLEAILEEMRSIPDPK